jgi:transposase-like protein
MDPKNWTRTLGVVKSRKEVPMTKRRSFSPKFKVRVVLELISGEKGLMQASREYGVKDTVLSRWSPETPADPNLWGSAQTCFLKG